MGQIAAQGALCPVLVGREDELNVLEDALLAANRGNGQLVLLAGDAGLGKTRLANELQARARKLGMTVLSGACSEADLAIPYLPFVEAIGNYLTAVGADAVGARLGRARLELGQLFPQLLIEGASLQFLDPAQAKLRLFESILALLRIPATDTGLLLVIEDLHWADGSTRELLDFLARRLESTRALVLASYRGDELHRKHPLAPLLQRWRRTNLVELVDLQPVRASDLARMVAAIFETDRVSDEFRDALYQRSEGNPFVLEEILKTSLDRGDLFKTSTGWDRIDVDAMELPETVKDTILIRIERLEPLHRRILKVAAVLGPSFEYQTLLAVSETSQEQMVSALEACVSMQLIVEEPGPSRRYRFRHALTREAIYGEIIGPERDRLHISAANVLQELTDPASIDVASHLVAANQWGRALPLCLEAAERAVRTGAFADAAELFSRALQHIQDKPLRGQVLCQLGTAYYFAFARPARARQYLEEGIELLEHLGLLRDAASHRLLLGRCYWSDAQPDRALAEYQMVRDLLEPEGPSRDLAGAYVRLSAMLNYQGQLGAAADMGRRAISTAETVGADDVRIEAQMYYAMALGSDESIGYLEQAYRDARERGLDDLAGRALGNQINLDAILYRARQDLPLLSKFEPLRAGGWETLFPLRFSGEIAWLLGNVQQACTLLEQVLTHPAAQPGTFKRWTEIWLVGVYWTMGRFDDARKVMPPVSANLERQDFDSRATVSIPMLLDAGEEELAVREAIAVADRADEGDWLPGKRWVNDAAVEALVRAGLTAIARDLVAKTRTGDATDRNPHQDRMEGRLALADGDLTAAVRRLIAAADFFRDAGYRLEESRTRRALAEALVRAGDSASAELQLRAVIEYADECGAVVEARLARHALTQLGVTVPEAPVVTTPAPTPSSIEQAGERLVSVLFIDVRGYTSMTARQSPASMMDRISAFYRWARHEVERHHGTVSHYAGDAVMATFNVTGTRIDHCAQALDCALTIADKAALMSLPVGSGIAVGPAIVGQLSQDSPLTAIGQTVNLAARLQGQAEAGEVLLSEEAFSRVRDQLPKGVVTSQPESLRLKGFDQPVTAYRVRPDR